MCDQQAENVRAEYAALIDYHNSVVAHRFTLAGLFLAAVAFIANDGMPLREACLLLGLTIAVYIVERRNRVLYTQMSKRAMEIEEKHWRLNRSGGDDKTVPLFCRFRLNELPNEVKSELPAGLAKELGAMGKWSFRRLTASHSKGLDLLYGLVAIYAVLSILEQLIRCQPNG